ncbi:hypothetical protein R6Q59_027223 [Mikania micrantha]
MGSTYGGDNFSTRSPTQVLAPAIYPFPWSQGAPCSENQEQIVIEVLRDNINGITKACYLSIGSQRFCERINGLIYEETHGVLMIILQND